MPIRWKKHTIIRLIERFDLDADEAEHYLRTGKIIKKVNKEGEFGIIQSKIGKGKIRFVITVRQGIIWVLTAEEG